MQISGMQKKSAAVVAYNPNWINDFNAIKDRALPLIEHLIVSFEHVGSTSVPGLTAKPIIDIDVVYDKPENLPQIIKALESTGYRYEGNKGVEGRESFKAPEGSIKQHFYVCKAGTLGLKNHLVLRDHLRNNSQDRDEYGKLKMEIAHLYQENPEAYMEAKTSFILKILKKHALTEDELKQIKAVNIAKK